MSASGPPGDVQEDLEKIRRYQQRGGPSFTPPALVEIVLFGLASVVGVSWIAAMFWVPEVIDGTTWMQLGAMGMLLTAGPGGLIYWFRRGGAREIERVLQSLLG